MSVLAYRQQAADWILQSGAVTAARGFRIDRLPAGTYKLEFVDSRDLDQARYAQKYWPNASSLDEATSFSVAAGSTVRKDSVVASTGRISGVVRGVDLTPLDGATVTAFERVGDEWVEVAGARTENGGHYESGRARPRWLRLRFFHRVTGAEDLAESWSGGGVDVASAAEVRGHVRRCDERRERRTHDGRHYQWAGDVPGVTPIDSGAIVVYRRASNGQWMQIPDAVGLAVDGRYEFLGLNPGTYRVGYSDVRGSYVREFFGESEELVGGTDVVVPPGGSPVTNIDLDVERAGRIQGRVIDPLVEFEAWDQHLVTVYRWTDEDWEWAASVKLGPRSNGEYDFGGLAPGRYRVGFSDRAAGNFWADEYWPEAPTLQRATDINVAGGEIETGKDDVLSPGIRNPVPPTVRGTPRASRSADRSPGALVAAQLGLVFQWFSDGDVIPGASSSTYSPTAGDRGRRSRVRVAGDRAGWVGVPVRSAATSPVQRGTILTRSRPRVQGQAVVGRTLRVTRGQWAPAGVRLAYTWLANGDPAGTGARLMLTRKHRGDRLTLKVRPRRSVTSRGCSAPSSRCGAALAPSRVPESDL